MTRARAFGTGTGPVAGVRGDVVWWRPPVRRRAFWMIQLAVLGIAAAHLLLEASGARFGGVSTLVVTTLYFVPVVYAAVTFGLAGSLATGVWCAVLSIPNVVLLHEGVDVLHEAWQVGTVVAVAAYIGLRVDRERRARDETERRERARRSSEAKYRGVFDEVAEPILLLDEAGVVRDANRAALGLLDRIPEAVVGHDVADLLGLDVAAWPAASRARDVISVRTGGRRDPVWIEPVVLPFAGPGGERELQLILRDVTARQVRGLALEAYARETVTAREEERRRIAREIHDGPVQSLVLLWRRLDALHADGPDTDRDLLEKARADTRAIADELRRLSRDLRPSVLDDLGLAAAVEAECARVAERAGIDVSVETAGVPRPLSGEHALMFFRIVQEALRNIERHAGARRAVVRLRYLPRSIRLAVADDGVGITPIPSTPQLLGSGRLGILGMRERARLADATFRIVSRRHRGTVLIVAVPG